jgi:hypothetical protein
LVPTDAEIQKKGLEYFRRVVALVYREIGVLRSGNHARIAAKAKLSGGFFGGDRKVQAKELYKLSLTDPNVDLTLSRYEKRTGLSLADLREAFAVGDWGQPPSFGGPKWAAIAAAAIELAGAVRGGASSEVARITAVVDGLEHNNGRIIAKFNQLD